MNRLQGAVLFVGLSGCVVLAACGGGADAGAPAKAPSSRAQEPAEERDPTSVPEAQDQIERARAELASADAKKSEAEKDSAGTGSTTTAKPSTSPAAREETTRAAPADPCAHSCRAIGSMRRAVTALCRMTGDEDARCSDARKTLRESESRVAQCHCGS